MGIDVERAFDDTVRRSGGQSVDELGIRDLCATKNADYIFRNENVLAELKRLVDQNPRLEEKLSAKYSELAQAGLVPTIYGSMVVSFRDLQPSAAEVMIKVLMPAVARTI